MATREQLEQALRAADAAGNTSDAQALAQALQGLEAPAAASSPVESGGIYSLPVIGPALQEESHLVNVGGGALAKGVGSLVALPGEAAQLAASYGPNWLAKPASAVASVLPDNSTVERGINALGLQGEAPQGRAENLFAGAMEGLGAGGPIGAMGGVGGEVAHELVPDSAIAPLVGSLVGGFGGDSVLGAFGARTLKKGLSAAEGDASLAGIAKTSAQETLDDLKDEGKAIGLRQSAQRLDHQEAYDAARAVHDSTVAAAKQEAQNAISQATGAANQTIESTASGLHPAKTLQEAGEAGQKSATNWLGQMDNKVGAILNPLYEKIPPETNVSLDNFKSALSDINSDAGALESLNQVLKPSLPKALAGRLQALEEGSALTGQPFNPSIRDLQTLRSSLGRAMSDPKVVNDTGGQNAAHLYAALTQDLRKPFADQGLGAEFDAANAQTKSLYDFARDTAGQLVASASGKGNLDPEKVAKSLLGAGSAGGSTLSELRSQMPDAADALAAAAIRTGTWQKMAPEAKAALVPDAASRTALDGAFASKSAATETANSALAAKVQASRDQLANLAQTQRQAQRDTARELLANKQKQAQASDLLDVMKQRERDTGEAVKGAGEKLSRATRKGEPFNPLTSLLGGTLGEQVGHLAAGHLLGLSPQATSVIGAGVPVAANLARNVWQQPSRLFPPLLALSAGNALATFPPESPEAPEAKP